MRTAGRASPCNNEPHSQSAAAGTSSAHAKAPLQSSGTVDLASIGLLDAAPDADLDRIARLAAEAAGTERAFISFLQGDLVRVIASHGSSVREAPAATSICAETSRRQETLIIPDLAADPLYAELPQVAQEDGNRFYAGFPISIDERNAIGTLCVIDREARPDGLAPATIRELEDLAQLAMRILTSHQQNSRWQEFMAIAADWIWEQDADFRFVYFSDSISDSGIDRSYFLGKTRWEVLARPGEDEAFWIEHRAMLEAHEPFEDFRYRWEYNGAIRYTSISGRPVFSNEGTFLGYRGSSRDVTAEEVARREVEHLAHHDPLTGLANRATFESQLADQLLTWQETGVSATVLLLDLDHFKRTNDTIGHSGGDALLVEVARRLKECSSPAATIARIGGDEFAILEPSLSRNGAAREFASTIVQALSKPYDLGERIESGCSIGIAVLPDHGATPSQIMGNVDLALYDAKSAGRGRSSFFHPDMRREADRRHDIARELANAQTYGQFTLLYQPVVRLPNEDICGVEALLRWNHPVRGQLSPSAFLGVLETSRHAADIGYWVLERACMEAGSWLAGAGRDSRLAVNLFSAQLRDPALVSQVRAILDKTGFDGRQLELEITEDVFLNQADDLLDTLGGLKRLGISLALDDFGTGFASLSHLLQFPVDRIKIDRQFVHGLGRNVDYGKVTNALVKLALELGLKVTAEGIESEEQRNFLRLIGCNDVQGYYYAKPLPASQISTLLAEPGPRLAGMKRL
ncbi:EAL domain-containing protein [Stappia sp. F7233]|uniref:EAL domain-containing protein n=1 Tax=Stappia albiluteola TaxID=2758565 RepID=A0A839ABC5_9HYPH|nr:GGDEF and EAL domain-containing protein [Stappia albiluteola]MBA5776207.1 EAL domain-containing protein [Stappia albiluteola]